VSLGLPVEVFGSLVSALRPEAAEVAGAIGVELGSFATETTSGGGSSSLIEFADFVDEEVVSPLLGIAAELDSVTAGP
jgi:hypothetical protein